MRGPAGPSACGTRAPEPRQRFRRRGGSRRDCRALKAARSCHDANSPRRQPGRLDGAGAPRPHGSRFPGSHSAWLRAPDAPAIPYEPPSLRRIPGEVENAGRLVQIQRKRAEIPYHTASQPHLELIGQHVVALPAPFPQRGDHTARGLCSAVRALLKRGQHPAPKACRPILRHDRICHLHDGRAVFRGDLNAQPDALFVDGHLPGFSERLMGGANSAYPRSVPRSAM